MFVEQKIRNAILGGVEGRISATTNLRVEDLLLELVLRLRRP